MGFYERRILPTLLDRMMSDEETARLRKAALAPARGRVLEVGFGTGLNVPHYPSTVSELVGVDPNPGMETLARERLGTAPMKGQFLLGRGDDRLPSDDGAFDTVVTTLVLCSVADVARALSEIRRVLRPGGQYLLLEHGLSPDADVQKWQKRLNGFSRTVLGGCNLIRPIAGLVADAGFAFETSHEFYRNGAPRFAGWTTSGIALRR